MARVAPRPGIEVAGGIERRGDLVGLEEGTMRRLGLQSAPPASRGIAADEVGVVLHRHVEDLRQAGDRLVDRGRRQALLAKLGVAVAVDLRDRDLRQAVAVMLGYALPAAITDAKAKAAQIKADRAKIMLGVAAVLGVGASCAFGLFFLRAVGMGASHTVDSFFTGITIAAGTKSLHDFISLVQNQTTPKTGTGTSGV